MTTARRADAIRRGARERKVSPADPDYVVAMGEAAEWRAAFELGAWASAPYADIRPMRSLGRDPGWDFVLRGRRVDVKWTPVALPGRCLLVFADRPRLADVYVSVVGETPDELVVAGWAYRREVEAAPIVNRTGRARSYCFPLNRLRPMRSLRRLPA
jgi:hypothetical protein